MSNKATLTINTATHSQLNDILDGAYVERQLITKQLGHMAMPYTELALALLNDALSRYENETTQQNTNPLI